MGRLNCWEFKKCGREPGGSRVDERGICPVALDERLNGVHHGKNAGRACWVLSGTLCTGAVNSSFTFRSNGCMNCSFFQLVRFEETSLFYVNPAQLLEYLCDCFA